MVVRGEFVGQVIASEDEFTCNECGKRFKKKKQLTDHKRNHKRTCCPWCGKEGSKNHLKRHMKTCDKKPMEVEVTGEQFAVGEAVVVAPDSLSSGDQETGVETDLSQASLSTGDQESWVETATTPTSGNQEPMDQETVPSSSPDNLSSGDPGAQGGDCPQLPWKPGAQGG